MSTYLSPQPTRPFTTPLTIPRPPNYNYHAYHPSLPYNPYTHRSNTPPSLSPSPAPSAASSTAATTTSMIEIEELPTDTDTDSAIATAAPFEFEEAPENYRRGRTLVYGSDDEEEDGGDDDDEDLLAASHKSILYGFERLTARGSGGGAGKRSYAESVGSVSSGGSWGDSGIESEGESGGEEVVEGGRRKVRRVHHRVAKPAAATVGGGFGYGYGYGCGWEDNEIDMEL